MADVTEDVIADEDMKAMIDKVVQYMKSGKSTREVIVEVGLAVGSKDMVTKFIRETGTRACQISMYKRFRDLFAKIDVNGDGSFIQRISLMRKLDVEGIEIPDNEMNAMIIKVREYMIAGNKTTRNIAVELGLQESSKNLVSHFLGKSRTPTAQVSMFMRFRELFRRIDANEPLPKGDKSANPLQAELDVVLSENRRLKKEKKALEFKVQERDAKIRKLIAGGPELHSPEKQIYETPIKPEPSSQDVNESKAMKEYRMVILRNHIRDILHDFQERRKKSTGKVYFMFDENGTVKYAGSTVQEIKDRLKNHLDCNTQVGNKELKKWIAAQKFLTAYEVYEGPLQECLIVEALMINSCDELGFKLLNKQKELSKLKTPSKLIQIDEDIAVLIHQFPIDRDATGRDELVQNLRYMVEKAYETRPVIHYRQSADLGSKNKAVRNIYDMLEDNDDEPAVKRARKEADHKEESDADDNDMNIGGVVNHKMFELDDKPFELVLSETDASEDESDASDPEEDGENDADLDKNVQNSEELD